MTIHQLETYHRIIDVVRAKLERRKGCGPF